MGLRPPRIPRSHPTPPEKTPSGRLGNADVTAVTKSSSVTARPSPHSHPLLEQNSLWLRLCLPGHPPTRARC